MKDLPLVGGDVEKLGGALEAAAKKLDELAPGAPWAVCMACRKGSSIFADVAAKLESVIDDLFNEKIISMAQNIINGINAKFAKICPKATKAPALAADEAPCDIAGDAVEKMIQKVATYLDDAGKEVANMKDLPLVGGDVEKLGGALEAAAKKLDELAPGAPWAVCMACHEANNIFNKVAAEVEKVIDDLFNEKVIGMAKRIVKGINAGFTKLCPKGSEDTENEKPNLAGEPSCITGNMIEQTLDQVNSYLKDAAGAVDAFVDVPYIGDDAKKLYDGLVQAETKIEDFAPMAAADACVVCAKVVPIFDDISKVVTDVVDQIGNAQIKDAASTVLSTIDKGLKTLCPSATIFERC